MAQYPAPAHVIAHISDTHFLEGGALLNGSIDTDVTLKQILRQLEGSGIRFDALVFTGDITDLGQADAYARIRSLVEPVAARLGAQLIWVMGNHDSRTRMRVDLLGEAASDTPVDRVFDLGGLRIIALDTSVPGFHHGALADEQLAWLREQLVVPAAHGTIIALHHPPIPTTLPLMPILELQEQDRLAEVIRGSDVRSILGGHMHYSAATMFAGVSVSVAAATCYTMDVVAPRGVLAGVAGGQSINLVEVYDDQIVHTVVPIGAFESVSGFGPEVVARVEALSPEDQLETFSRHRASTD